MAAELTCLAHEIPANLGWIILGWLGVSVVVSFAIGAICALDR